MNNTVIMNNEAFEVLPCRNANNKDKTQYNLLIKNNKSIGIINFRNGMGILNKNSNKIEDLQHGQFAKFNLSFVHACLRACPPLQD